MRMPVGLGLVSPPKSELPPSFKVNLLKQEPSQMSWKMKRYKAGIDNDFLIQILKSSVSEIWAGPNASNTYHNQ